MTPRAQAVLGWVLGAIAFAAISAQLGCAVDDVKPPKTPGVLVGEQYCKAYGLSCGKVYQFEAPASNELGHVEKCVTDELLALAVARYGAAQLSTHERFDQGNLCYWQCPSAKGCNAFDGCLCGEGLL